MDKDDAKMFTFVTLLLTEYHLPPKDVAPRMSLRSKFFGNFLNSVQFFELKVNTEVPSTTHTKDPTVVLIAIQLLTHLSGYTSGSSPFFVIVVELEKSIDCMDLWEEGAINC